MKTLTKIFESIRDCASEGLANYQIGELESAVEWVEGIPDEARDLLNQLEALIAEEDSNDQPK